MADRSFGVGGSSTDERRPDVLAVQVLGWVGSALLVYSVLQTRILRLRLFNGVRVGAAGDLQRGHRGVADGRAERDAHRDQRFLYRAAATWQTRLADLRVLTGAETVGLVLARNASEGSAQVDLDYVVPRYQGFTLGEFVYRPGGPLAARGYRRVIAPPRMQNAGDYLTDVGFRPEGDAMVRDLA